MKKILDNFLTVTKKIFLGIFIYLLFWIISISILDYDPVVYNFNMFCVIIGIFLYILFMFFFYKKIIPKLAKIKYLPICLLAISTIFCFVIAYKLRLNPQWDMGCVYYVAKNIVEKGSFCNNYLFVYPFNTLLTLIYAVIFKIFHCIPNVDYIVVVTIFNSFVVSLVIFFTYLSAKKLLGNEKSLLLLFILMFTTPLYFYGAIYYSDAISALFAVIMFYLYLLIDETEKSKKKIVLEILFGIALFMGMKIKITSSFLFIGIFVYSIWNKKIKEFFSNFGISIFVCLLFTICFNLFLNLKIDNYKENLYTYKKPLYQGILFGLERTRRI